MLKQIAGKSKFRCADRSNVANGINFAGLTGGTPPENNRRSRLWSVRPTTVFLIFVGGDPGSVNGAVLAQEPAAEGRKSPWVIPESEPPAALPPGDYVYARVREGHEQVAPVRDAAGRRQGHSQRDCFGIKSLAAENPLDFPSQAVGESTGTTHSLDDIFATSIGCPPDRARCQASPHRSFEMAWGH